MSQKGSLRYQIVENENVLKALYLLPDSLRKRVIEITIEKSDNTSNSLCFSKEALDREFHFLMKLD
jgi:hypothetical protein